MQSTFQFSPTRLVNSKETTGFNITIGISSPTVVGFGRDLVGIKYEFDPYHSPTLSLLEKKNYHTCCFFFVSLSLDKKQSIVLTNNK